MRNFLIRFWKCSLWVTVWIGSWIGSAEATRFANQFCEFELPHQWSCQLEGAEWVCQSTEGSKKKDAIIVLAAKLKGDQDSLDQYLNYLKAAKVFTSVQGKSVKSQPRYAKTANLNGHPWVDALHLESELPGFYTRYLATVKQDIGVLVTYSVNQSKYNQYLDSFEQLTKTLKVFRKPGGINVAPAQDPLFQTAQVPPSVSMESVFPTAQIQGGAPEGVSVATQKDTKGSLIWILLGVIAVIGFIWKLKKNNH